MSGAPGLTPSPARGGGLATGRAPSVLFRPGLQNDRFAPFPPFGERSGRQFCAGSLKGVAIPMERWQAISNYASSHFPETGIAFGDVHAAIAHAMAHNMEPLSKIASGAKGPANDIVRPLASAFKAIAAENWDIALGYLMEGMVDHARIGGSKAQRDLLEFTLFNALLKLGQREEAKRLLSLRRPICAQDEALNDV